MSHRRILGAAFAVYVVLAAAFAGAELAFAGRFGPAIDDGWIYMAFARSLAMGEGVTYPGHDGPLCAVTGPVWCAILALAFLAAGPSPLVAELCGMLTGAFAVWAVYRLGASATRDRRLGAVAALVVAATARFVWGALSVMEVPFFVGAVCWGLALHLDRRALSFWRWLPALVVLWLAGWARPECFVFAVVAALHRPRPAAAIGALAGLLALYPAYHLAIYGHPLPTTFYAKAAGAAPWAVLAREGATAALEAAFVGPLDQLLKFATWLPTHLPLLALGFLPGVARGFRARRGVGFVAFALLAFVLVRGLLGVVAPSFQYGRYFAHVWALFVVVAVQGLAGKPADWRPSLLVLGAVAALCVAYPLQALAFVFDWLVPGASLTVEDAVAITRVGAVAAIGLFVLGVFTRSRPPAWACAAYLLVAAGFGAVRNGRNVADTYAMNVAMAEQVAAIVPPGETVVCHDIGALGFFADRPLLDLAGLGSPEVVFRERRLDGGIDAQAVLVASRARWLCVTEAMFDNVMGRPVSLPGLVAAAPRHTIERPENVTLLGTRYHLIELTWER